MKLSLHNFFPGLALPVFLLAFSLALALPSRAQTSLARISVDNLTNHKTFDRIANQSRRRLAGGFLSVIASPTPHYRRYWPRN